MPSVLQKLLYVGWSQRPFRSSQKPCTVGCYTLWSFRVLEWQHVDGLLWRSLLSLFFNISVLIAFFHSLGTVSVLTTALKAPESGSELSRSLLLSFQLQSGLLLVCYCSSFGLRLSLLHLWVLIVLPLSPFLWCSALCPHTASDRTLHISLKLFLYR